MTTTAHWLDEGQQALWQDLLTVIIGLPTLLDRQLERAAHVSNYEYSVLARLSMTTGRTIRLSQLAEQCSSTLPRLSKVMARFEKRGWTTRSTDPDDGRYTLAQLTPAGLQQVVDSAPGHVEEVRRLVLDPLTVTQQRQLAAALAPVAEKVRASLDPR